MTVLIIEDEQDSGNRLQEMIKKVDNSIITLPVLMSVESTLKWFRENQQPDLLICDVHLEDGNCFAIFEKVKITVPVIFTTSYNQYAIEAFSVNSIGYLLKPVQFEDLRNCLQKYELYVNPGDINILEELSKIVATTRTYKSRFTSRVKGEIHIINVQDIAYFHSKYRGIYLVTHDNKSFLLNYTLKQLEETLDPKRFFRLNKKYIASIDSIEKVTIYSSSRTRVYLKNCSERVLAPREKSTTFKRWLEA